jgi:hypothetical protein
MAIFDGDWKLIQSMDGRLSLYNLKEDSQERNNVWEENKDVGERLQKSLKEITGSFPNLSQRRGPPPRSPRPSAR